MPFPISLGLIAGLVVVMFWVLSMQQRTLLKEQVMTDPLTGAFNRRHLDCCLQTAIARRSRMGEPASLLMLDVDHFKDINDALGHAAGDRVLKQLVALASARSRKLDVLFRVGGKEFLLLLPGSAHDGALTVAEGLRRAIAAADLLHGRRLSVSIGVSELQHGQAASNWIEDADAALYRAKRGGRNRVDLSRAALASLVRPAHQ
jgi:diguanylate cyclase (GGDEF)-like protein